MLLSPLLQGLAKWLLSPLLQGVGAVALVARAGSPQGLPQYQMCLSFQVVIGSASQAFLQGFLADVPVVTLTKNIQVLGAGSLAP